ncbi:MAG TPA: NAD(P)H-dependent oxidoreductase [Candidatus Nitrosotalea sp.]|nr:NAD(P)H-dependent oxidoreductase [Candidatus Nitrosotalea sp.]
MHYTPRNELSNTRKLLDAFRSGIKNSAVEELSLSRESPDLFLEENLSAYIQRNYLGQNLSPPQKQLMAKMDGMTDQLVNADIVVVAYPMYNFSMPASVKAWFDSVMLKGRTWDARDGRYVGLMRDKKALVLVASGGFYGKEPTASWEHALSLGKVEFQFMGYSDVRGVLAEGMSSIDAKESSLQASIAEVQKIAQEWYGSDHG